MSRNEDEIAKIKKSLGSSFKITDKGRLKNFLGISINRKADTLELSQTKYIENLLHEFGRSECKPTSIPSPTTFKFEKFEESRNDWQTTISVTGWKPDSLIKCHSTRHPICHWTTLQVHVLFKASAFPSGQTCTLIHAKHQTRPTCLPQKHKSTIYGNLLWRRLCKRRKIKIYFPGSCFSLRQCNRLVQSCAIKCCSFNMRTRSFIHQRRCAECSLLQRFLIWTHSMSQPWTNQDVQW